MPVPALLERREVSNQIRPLLHVVNLKTQPLTRYQRLGIFQPGIQHLRRPAQPGVRQFIQVFLVWPTAKAATHHAAVSRAGFTTVNCVARCTLRTGSGGALRHVQRLQMTSRFSWRNRRGLASMDTWKISLLDSLLCGNCQQGRFHQNLLNPGTIWPRKTNIKIRFFTSER